jgi:hypothetical protein
VAVIPDTPVSASSHPRGVTVAQYWGQLPADAAAPRNLRQRFSCRHNTDRAHTGRWTKGRTPEEVLGKVKMWSR